MNTPKHATVYFDMVNDALKASLAKDAGDLTAFTERKNEKSLSFETFVHREVTLFKIGPRKDVYR